MHTVPPFFCIGLPTQYTHWSAPKSFPSDKTSWRPRMSPKVRWCARRKGSTAVILWLGRCRLAPASARWSQVPDSVCGPWRKTPALSSGTGLCSSLRGSPGCFGVGGRSPGLPRCAGCCSPAPNACDQHFLMLGHTVGIL
uniref:Uncharacterized protein n=1 Tax=Rousettus aegyptiacus TaxID=9407 RepID=A0A7J8BF48_ROUAE|nr:hypothetical protein HJG63_009775 [Rousettus aegyptiacus]